MTFSTSGILFFVEPVAITLVLIRIVTSHCIRRYLLVSVSKVDVTHVILVVQ